jgi:hypothetical protein
VSAPGVPVGVGEPVVGEVGLPALVRERGGEAEVGGLGPLPRLRGDQAILGQVAADRGHRDRHLVGALQVPDDGVRAGIQTGGRELLAQFEDQVDGGLRGRIR